MRLLILASDWPQILYLAENQQKNLPFPGRFSYALMIFSINSDHLIEDNIMFRNRYSMVFEGGGAGCVVAYNYSVGVLLLPDRNFGAYDLDTHGSHPFMNLFEGNVVTDSNYFVDVGLVPD